VNTPGLTKLGLEAQNHAAEVKLRAERKAGKLLEKMEKNEGVRMNGRDSFGGNMMLPPKEEIPTLAELDITKTQSSRWQAIATLPEETFEQPDPPKVFSKYVRIHL
jgi:hypothetical protein